jgi:hypothetical protein
MKAIVIKRCKCKLKRGCMCGCVVLSSSIDAMIRLCLWEKTIWKPSSKQKCNKYQCQCIKVHWQICHALHTQGHQMDQYCSCTISQTKKVGFGDYWNKMVAPIRTRNKTLAFGAQQTKNTCRIYSGTTNQKLDKEHKILTRFRFWNVNWEMS